MYIDLNTAKKWYQKAMEAGYEDSMHALSYGYAFFEKLCFMPATAPLNSVFTL